MTAVLAVVLALLVGTVERAGAVWHTNGPSGGDVTALAVDASGASTVYAGTSFDGVFRSTDGGASWQSARNGLTNDVVYALVADPVTVGVVYAATNDTVFKSSDRGATWQALRTGLTRTGITALAVDPTDPQVLYAGVAGTTGGGVFRSANGGASWSLVATGLPPSVTIHALAVDPTTSAKVYVGTVANGVYRSTDSGGTWSAATGTEKQTVLALAVDPATPDTVYAATLGGKGVYKSVNAGAVFASANSGLPSSRVFALAVDPSTPTTLYAGTFGGTVARSTNAAGQWSTFGSGIIGTNVGALALDPLSPNVLLAGTPGAGVFRTTGGAWSQTTAGLDATRTAALVAIAALGATGGAPTTLVAASEGGGIVASPDAGTTWAPANVGLPTARLSALASDPSTAGRVYAAGGGVYRSDDGAATWTTVVASFDAGPTALIVDPGDPSMLYAGTLLNGVQRSTTGGASWEARNDGLDRTDVLTLAVDPSDATIFYVGLDTGGLFKSTDATGSWGPTGLTDVSVRSIAVDPSNAAVVYAGTLVDGVFKSSDGGTTFAPASQGLTTLEITTLAIDPTSTTTLYAGTARDGVFRSLDGAATWTAFAVGLPPVRVGAFAIDGADADVLYAGTRGVYAFEPRCLESCGTCEVCDTLAGCVGKPRLDCRLPSVANAADLTIVNRARDTSDALTWHWLKGAATQAVDFGDPTTADGYTLCVFDESAALPRLLIGTTVPPGGTCGRKPCWTGIGRPRGAKGFRYADSKGQVQGITGITLTPGITGKAKITVKGKGGALGLEPLPAPVPLRVQLEAANGACFSALYPAAGVRKNDSARFKAKAVAP